MTARDLDFLFDTLAGSEADRSALRSLATDTREVAGPFPGQVPKTDEIRLQSALGVLDEIRGLDF